MKKLESEIIKPGFCGSELSQILNSIIGESRVYVGTQVGRQPCANLACKCKTKQRKVSCLVRMPVSLHSFNLTLELGRFSIHGSVVVTANSLDDSRFFLFIEFFLILVNMRPIGCLIRFSFFYFISPYLQLAHFKLQVV